MSTVLILALSDLESDPRVNRQIRFLHGQYDVIAAGYAAPAIAGIRFVSFPRRQKDIFGKAKAAWRLLSRDFDTLYWERNVIVEAHQLLSSCHADIIIANEVGTLPLAVRLAETWNARVLFDAHEYAPRELEDLWRWRWLEAPSVLGLCRKYIPRVHAMTTVCQGIADAYHSLTGVRATVLTNAPDYDDQLVPTQVAGNLIRLVYHGAAIRSRKLENMIDMMNHLDPRFDLTFVLMGDDWKYRRRLENLAAGTRRVRFLAPVAMRELPPFLNQFDIGLFLLEPTNFNYLHALPNKLFEFIQARLAVAVGPSPEMSRVVTQAGVGVVGADFKPATLAARLNRLSADDVKQYKCRAHAVAREYSAERNRPILLDLCAQLYPPKNSNQHQSRDRVA